MSLIHRGPIPTSLACPVVALSCFACLLLRTISRPFETPKTHAGINVNTYILSNVLLCSIVENVYSLFVFWLALRARQNIAQLLKILSDTTTKCLIRDLLSSTPNCYARAGKVCGNLFTSYAWQKYAKRNRIGVPTKWWNWKLRWKKGGRFFTQNWTLSETLQISHVVLIRYVKECSVYFLAEVCLVFEILRMQKTCILWSRQHVTAKTVISLKTKQNIEVLQRATLKSVHFR